LQQTFFEHRNQHSFCSFRFLYSYHCTRSGQLHFCCAAIGKFSITVAKALSNTSCAKPHLASSAFPPSWHRRNPRTCHQPLHHGLTHRHAAGVKKHKFDTRQQSWCPGVSIQFGIARRSRHHLVHHLRPGVFNSHLLSFFFFCRAVLFPSPAAIFSFQRTKQLESPGRNQRFDYNITFAQCANSTSDSRDSEPREPE
jgi:hypothetical protein